MPKMHTHAPLPFIGQKRAFLKPYIQTLHALIPDDGAGWTILDAFGGSGLLSHAAKHHKQAARVIYNDFDGYADRLRHIDDINRLRRLLADILHDSPRNKLIDSGTKSAIAAAIYAFDGYIDLNCLISWLLYSGKQAGSIEELLKETLYHSLRRSDVPIADGYLDGLEITRETYATLLPKYTADSRCLLVLDPPYICTMQGAYRNDTYFGMVQFLRLMQHVRPPFIFFSSTRSELLDYLNLVIAEHYPGWERFAGYQVISVKKRLNKTAQYEDNLVFKFA